MRFEKSPTARTRKHQPVPSSSFILIWSSRNGGYDSIPPVTVVHNDVFFLGHQKSLFFANFLAFSPSGVSISPSGISFLPTFLTMRAPFAPNRPHRIGPYPGHTNVPAPPPPLHPARPTYQPPHQNPARLPYPTRPNPPPPSHVAPVVPAWPAAMVPRLQCPSLLAKARKALIKMVSFSPGGVSFSPTGVSFSPYQSMYTYILPERWWVCPMRCGRLPLLRRATRT